MSIRLQIKAYIIMHTCMKIQRWVSYVRLDYARLDLID